MSLVWGFIWAISTSFAVGITIKYYLPILFKRLQKTTTETQVIVEDSRIEKQKSVILTIMLVIIILFSGACGCVAGNNMTSFIGMLKMILAYLVLICILITDFKCRLIPNLFCVTLIAGRGITIILEVIFIKDLAWQWLLNSILAMVAVGLILILVSVITKGGIGMGDVKLFSSLGFLCGLRAVCVTLILAFLLCSVISAFLLIFRKKKMKDSLPLGPFIWLGYSIAVLLSAI